MIIHNPILTGSFSVNGADLSTITGSVATSASFDARTTYLESTSSILTAASASQSVTSGSLVAASASLSATSGSLSAASGSFNTRVSALEVTGSALSSSLLTVSGSGYATSASLSAASGSFNSRVATIESKYATTGSNTFIGTQVVSGSILQSGSFTSTGTLTAQTLVIQTITSSVVYSSGSNVFGNSLGNSQVFTGSVLITGSLTIAGASSATSYSGVTIYGSTTVCSAVGFFSGCVGIGTVSPGAKLEVVKADENVLKLKNSGGQPSLVRFNDTSTTLDPYIGSYGNDLAFGTYGGGEKMRITSGGNLGIGIASPLSKLDVRDASAVMGNYQTIQAFSTDSAAINLGGGISLGGYYTSTTSIAQFASIVGRKENSTSGNYDGYLAFGTNSQATGVRETMRLTSSGNLGLGVTPSAWSTSFGIKVIDVGSKGTFYASDNDANISFNQYFDGTNAVYKTTGTASRLALVGNEFQWRTAPSGTAGAAITFTQAMTLTAAGRLLINTPTESTYQLDVNGTGRFSGVLSANNTITIGNGTTAANSSISLLGVAGVSYTWSITNDANGLSLGGGTNPSLRLNGATGAATFSSSVTANGLYANAGNSARFYRSANDYYWSINSDASNYLNFGTYLANGTAYGTNPKVVLFDSGNVGIGTAATDSGYKLDVNGTGRFSDNLTINGTNKNVQLGSSTLPTTSDNLRHYFAGSATFVGQDGVGEANVGNNFYYNSAFLRRVTDYSSNIRFNAGNIYLQVAASGAANSAISWTNALTIASTGAATFSSNVAIEAQLSFNSAALNIYTYGRVGLANAGRIIFNNGTGANMFLGELASNVYGFTANAYNSTAVLSMNMSSNAVSVAGALSKGSGTFRIDHPLESKKNTHHLIHSFVEGPRADLIYRGKVTLVNGTATINIDETVGMTEGTFIALNRDIQCFTTNESGWDLVKGKVEGNILTITSQNTESTNEISWMVVGERQDEHIKNTDWTDENGKPILEPLKIT